MPGSGWVVVSERADSSKPYDGAAAWAREHVDRKASLEQLGPRPVARARSLGSLLAFLALGSRPWDDAGKQRAGWRENRSGRSPALVDAPWTSELRSRRWSRSTRTVPRSFRRGAHSTHGSAEIASPQRAGSIVEGHVGVGLYIAKEIVEAHGGTLRATSSSADGTVFEVVLPRDETVGPSRDGADGDERDRMAARAGRG